MKKQAFVIIAFLLFAFSSMAVPAFPDLVTFRQPNSELTVSIFLKGDERVHWAESEDGYSLLHADDGTLMYAYRDADGNMVPSAYMATEVKDRSEEVNAFLSLVPKHLRYSKQQVDQLLEIWTMVENHASNRKTMTNVVGEKKFLVILFAFADKPFGHSRMLFRQMFNQVNYSTNNAIGSVHDYYYDVSGGLFSLSVDVVGPYTGAYNTAYYGANDYGGQYMAEEAVDSASREVDFSDYDNDNDGYIDGLHIIFAGHGEEAGASSDCIWSHKWNIFSEPVYNNTIVNVYSCSPECNGSEGNRMTNIGVICHELGHVFGAPDYYDTDYAGSGGQFPGLGEWDIMSGGSWNRGGISPAHHNPYTKAYIYGWTTIDTLTNADQVITLNAAEKGQGDYYRVNTSTPGDFFILENRQRIKWDYPLPGTGMLVYHVHPHAHGASVTNRTHPQELYLLGHCSLVDTFPTGTPSSYGTINDGYTTYPDIYGGRDSLTDFTIPWFRPWSKARNYTSLYNISNNTQTQVVNFCVGNASPDPMQLVAEGVSDHQVLLNWQRYGSYRTVVLMSADANSFGLPAGDLQVGDTVDGGGIVVYSGNGDRVVVDSLSTSHVYYFKAFSFYHGSEYSKGVLASASPLQCNNWTEETFDDTDFSELPLCWSGSWSVDTVDYVGRALYSCTSCQSPAATWNSVMSAPFSFDSVAPAVLKLKLHYGDNCNASTRFRIEYRNVPTGDWTEVYETAWTFGAADWGQVYVYLPEAGANSRLRFSALSDGLAEVAIDDVSIEQGCLVYAHSDDNGTIEPYGYSIVEPNTTTTFSITPLAGYKLAVLRVDGVRITVADSSSLELVATGSHDVYATFEAKLSIDEVEAPHIYPNPTSNMLFVEAAAGSEIMLFDIVGRQLLHQEAADGVTQLDLSSLPIGVYMLRCGAATVKVVKR